MLQTYKEKKNKLKAVIEENKCIEQITVPILVHPYASYTELPSYISTMVDILAQLG